MTDDISTPAIGVTWVTRGLDVSERYMAAVVAAGGRAMALDAGARAWTTEVADICGLLLTGGGDIDPSRYGATRSRESMNVDQRRDELEIETLRHCLERRMPILGICRGFQLINIVLGGTLLQNLATPIEHRAIEGRSSFHSIEWVESDALPELTRHEQLWVNSRHHQGVRPEQLADMLRISALSADGLVEAFEADNDEFIVGLQCHPERREEVPQMSCAFSSLAEAARRFAEYRRDS